MTNELKAIFASCKTSRAARSAGADQLCYGDTKVASALFAQAAVLEALEERKPRLAALCSRRVGELLAAM